jgi:hypothetical protein
MVRIILGVIVGFIVWSIVWVGGQATMVALSPDWIGAYIAAAERSVADGSPFTPVASIAAINLIRSLLTSFIAGYMAALVAGEYKRSTMALGVILVIVGVAVEFLYWNVAPAWYHIIFVLALIPMTILGGRLRRPN